MTRWVRITTLAAVSVVAAVAAIVSYVHMRELAIRAGEQWRADIIPLSADGLLVAASMVMLVRRRAGEPAGPLPWLGLVLGLTASLAANLAIADWSNLVSLAVSGWPPVALAVSFELLILVTRDQQQASTTSPGPAVEPAQPPAPAARPATPPKTRQRRDDAPSPAAAEPTEPVDQDDLDSKAARLIAQGLGKVRLQRELGVTEHKAKSLIKAHSTNGHNPAEPS